MPDTVDVEAISALATNMLFLHVWKHPSLDYYYFWFCKLLQVLPSLHSLPLPVLHIVPSLATGVRRSCSKHSRMFYTFVSVCLKGAQFLCASFVFCLIYFGTLFPDVLLDEGTKPEGNRV